MILFNTGWFLNVTGNAILPEITIIKDKISDSLLFTAVSHLLTVFFIFLSVVSILLLIRKVSKKS